jgi:hypothetical protein
MKDLLGDPIRTPAETRVDVLALHAQCARYEIVPHVTETLVSAHALLTRLPRVIHRGTYQLTPRVESFGGEEWCAWLGGSVHVGSFEDCVTALARRLTP